MNVYEPKAFEDRVNYAASVISKGIVLMNGRCFDTCFEMNDGGYVIAALARRATDRPNTQLAKNLLKFINADAIKENYEKTKHLTRRELRETALSETAKISNANKAAQ